MNDDDIYDFVRTGLAELATQARPVDLAIPVLRRVRRRRVSMSIAAVCLAGAMVIGVPIAVAAAGVDAGGRPLAPTGSPSLSFGRPTPTPTGTVVRPASQHRR